MNAKLNYFLEKKKRQFFVAFKIINNIEIIQDYVKNFDFK